MPQAYAVRGRCVVVTGAAGGIGAALARRFVAEGATVAINDLDAERLAATADAIGAVAICADSASEDGVAAVVAAARERLGRIDIWCANAGVDKGRGLQASETDWERSWEINVMAAVRAARLLIPEWLDRGSGRFVVTASAAGLLSMLGAPAYSVTKHAAVAFAEWLQVTYAHRGIAVHAICPQGVKTPMLDRAGPLTEILTRDQALEPEDVADALIAAIDEGRFLVLPHPEVGGYYAARASDPDTWLRGMNQLQQRLDKLPTGG